MRSWVHFDEFFPQEAWLVYFDTLCRERSGIGLDDLRRPENISAFTKCIDIVIFADIVESGKPFYSQI